MENATLNLKINKWIKAVIVIIKEYKKLEDSYIRAFDDIIYYYCCPLKVSEQRDIHPQCCCNGIADDFSEGKPLS